MGRLPSVSQEWPVFVFQVPDGIQEGGPSTTRKQSLIVGFRMGEDVMSSSGLLAIFLSCLCILFTTSQNGSNHVEKSEAGVHVN